jgi:hypothetical protein
VHKDKFVTKWVTSIKSRMAGMCEDGFLIPIIALFYNDAATVEILESKRRMRLELATIEQRSQMQKNLPWYSVAKRLSFFLTLWRDRMAVQIGVWRHEPPVEAVDRCISSPEFELLKYLHKLTERMAAWRAFPDKHLPQDQLPKEFIDLQGQLDAPQSVYERLHRIQESVDAFIPAEMQRTMFVLMLSKIMRHSEQLHFSHKAYVADAKAILRLSYGRFVVGCLHAMQVHQSAA